MSEDLDLFSTYLKLCGLDGETTTRIYKLVDRTIHFRVANRRLLVR